MLRLKHKHHLDFPHMSFSMPRGMELSPVAADDDELAQAIDNDVRVQENDWELVERPDTVELEEFWRHVQDDVRTDPDWIDFSKE